MGVWGSGGPGRTVRMIPLPATEWRCKLLDAKVRKVDWTSQRRVLGIVVRSGCTSFSMTRIQDMEEISTARISWMSSMRWGWRRQLPPWHQSDDGLTVLDPRCTVVPSERISLKSPATRPFAAAVCEEHCQCYSTAARQAVD